MRNHSCSRGLCLRILVPLLVAACTAGFPCLAEGTTGPWKLETLKKTPAATWGEPSEGICEVYYEGEPLAGKPTRVFAYYARPKEGKGPFPAMVLVHGGGGTAFREWTELWAKRGYCALAMDLAGCGPNRKKLPDGGPGQDAHAKFDKLKEAEIDQMWTYHAVAAVIRGHSLLASREEVDAARIGITGISWGGYLTCIVAGIDDRLKVAVPVYGCGFLNEDSVWEERGQFAQLGPEVTRQWIQNFDPSQYLPGVRCPILFVNGTNDGAYYLGSYRKSYRLVPGEKTLRIQSPMPHSHPDGWAPKEIGLFTDSVLRGGKPLARLSPLTIGEGRAKARFTAEVPIVKAWLHYTTDTGPWKKRRWERVDATIGSGTVSAPLPTQRPLVCFLNALDERDAMVSTEHVELP